jgi:hypothetical protein
MWINLSTSFKKWNTSLFNLPVWILLWVFNDDDVEKHFPQSSHLFGFSPVCDRTCLWRSDGLSKNLKQISQTRTFRKVWSLMTFSLVMFSRHFGYFKRILSFDSHSVDFLFELLFRKVLQLLFFIDKSNGISILTLEIILIDWRVIVEKCSYLYTHSSVPIQKNENFPVYQKCFDFLGSIDTGAYGWKS